MPREMKDSGLPWVGKIPASWVLMPNKYIMKKIKEIVPIYNGEDIISLSTNGVIIRDLDAGGKMPTSFDGYQKVTPGNLLMCLFDMDVTPRCIGLIKNAGVTSPAYSQFCMLNGMYAPYYNYYYLMVDFKKSILHLAKNMRHSFTETELGKIKVPVPSINEQYRIADFLDAKCAAIDAAIEIAKKEIETYEEYKRAIITKAVTKGLDDNASTKESGVFYIGPVNKDWNVSKIGYVCEKLSRPFSNDDTALICSNSGKVLVRPDDMVGKMVSEDNAMQGIHKGDIAIHGMDTWHGAIGLSLLDGKITRVVHVCNSSGDNRFIVYYLRHLAFQNVYKLITNGVRGNTSDLRSWDKVKDIYIYLPSHHEQRLIADYLDAKCNQIDCLIDLKQKTIDTLAEYKKTLIYAYVTGKKGVPNG